jgi:hemolysin III
MSKPFLVAYPFSLGIPQLALPTGALFGCQTGSLFDCQFQGRGKQVFRTLEHCAIFVLIAGTYTPVTLIAIRGAWGWTLFGLVWSLAGAGMLLKTLTTTKYRWLPGVLYLALAWLIVVAIGPLSLRERDPQGAPQQRIAECVMRKRRKRPAARETRLRLQQLLE